MWILPCCGGYCVGFTVEFSVVGTAGVVYCWNYVAGAVVVTVVVN